MSLKKAFKSSFGGKESLGDSAAGDSAGTPCATLALEGEVVSLGTRFQRDSATPNSFTCSKKNPHPSLGMLDSSCQQVKERGAVYFSLAYLNPYNYSSYGSMHNYLFWAPSRIFPFKTAPT